jgi:hypothetical protein
MVHLAVWPESQGDPFHSIAEIKVALDRAARLLKREDDREILRRVRANISEDGTN